MPYGSSFYEKACGGNKSFFQRELGKKIEVLLELQKT